MISFPIPPPEGVQTVLLLQDAPVLIGTGGFKAVYRMETPAGPEAIKAVYVPPLGDEEGDAARAQLRAQMIARAEREIEALRACACPVLVKLGSLSPALHTIYGHDYLIYSEELLTGRSLTQWNSREQRPSLHELVTVFETLIRLIRDLSGAGYLHRDIKPANIMETGLADRPFVVLDLGIAFKMHGTALTQGGGPPGTLLYMAPELLKPDYKDAMDFRCDLYAAGLTVYVLAAGLHPFARQPEHEYATAYRIMVQSPTPLHKFRADLPEAFCAIIDRCIRKKPALRYARLELVVNALKEVLL